MKFWVVGAGAIGCVVGGRLCASHDVTFVDRSAVQVNGLRRSGLVVCYPGGATVRAYPHAYLMNEVWRIPTSPDVVLLSVKAYATSAVCQAIAMRLAPSTLVVSLQNGITVDTIGKFVGPNRTVGGVCLFDGERTGPGSARQVRVRPLILGPVGAVAWSRMEELKLALNASVPVVVTSNIRSHLWSKLIRNAMINGACAATGLSIHELLKSELARALCVGLGVEGVRVASSLGIPLMASELYGHTASDYLSGSTGVSEAIARNMVAAYEPFPNLCPSMLRDVMGGQPTEIEELNGYIVLLAEGGGLHVPLNAGMVDLIRAVEEGSVRPHRSVVGEWFGTTLDKCERD
ncbi:MAG: ketopantoate reductase family protein [Candidatus Dormibacteria bacterium]